MTTVSKTPVSECILCKTGRRHMVCIGESRPTKSAESAPFRKTMSWIGKLAVLAFCLFVLSGGFSNWIRNSFPHDRTLDVYMRSNWLVGENRLCWLGVQPDANG